MKTFPLFLLSTLLGLSSWVQAEDQRVCDMKMESDEHWWAGVTSESHRMPLTAESKFECDFYGDTLGNQAQPLLISDHGRFIWCEDPFRFKVADGVIHVDSTLRPLQVHTNLSSLREGYLRASRAYFPPSGRTPDALLFTKPQFNTWIELTYNQNQKDVLRYARSAVEAGFPTGVLMIDAGWSKTYGDLDFDRGRFDDPQAMMKELHGLGFKVMLWVCPYLAPAGPFYTDLALDQTRKGRPIWIQNDANPSQPALMEWWDGFCAVLDLTNPEGHRWFKAQLDRLVTTYGVDGFKFDGGDAEYYLKTMLSKPRSFNPGATPNEHCEAFARLGLEYPMNEFRACWKMGGQPLAQRLRDKNHTWEDLRKLIPGSINQGLMGYAFTCPDLIGGGEYLSFLDQNQIDQELIVRAAQCHALMPMMQFSVAPWRVLSQENLAICRQMAELHARLGEEILALARDSAQTGEPIVRALEYEYPGRGYAGITDQYLLGPSVLVAPVLEKGARRRVVEFPPGVWQGDDGSVVTGPCRVEVTAPMNRLPWYRNRSRRPPSSGGRSE